MSDPSPDRSYVLEMTNKLEDAASVTSNDSLLTEVETSMHRSIEIDFRPASQEAVAPDAETSLLAILEEYKQRVNTLVADNHFLRDENGRLQGALANNPPPVLAPEPAPKKKKGPRQRRPKKKGNAAIGHVGDVQDDAVGDPDHDGGDDEAVEGEIPNEPMVEPQRDTGDSGQQNIPGQCRGIQEPSFRDNDRDDATEPNSAEENHDGDTQCSLTAMVDATATEPLPRCGKCHVYKKRVKAARSAYAKVFRTAEITKDEFIAMLNVQWEFDGMPSEADDCSLEGRPDGYGGCAHHRGSAKSKEMLLQLAQRYALCVQLREKFQYFKEPETVVLSPEEAMQDMAYMDKEQLPTQESAPENMKPGDIDANRDQVGILKAKTLVMESQEVEPQGGEVIKDEPASPQEVELAEVGAMQSNEKISPYTLEELPQETLPNIPISDPLTKPNYVDAETMTSPLAESIATKLSSHRGDLRESNMGHAPESDGLVSISKALLGNTESQASFPSQENCICTRTSNSFLESSQLDMVEFTESNPAVNPHSQWSSKTPTLKIIRPYLKFAENKVKPVQPPCAPHRGGKGLPEKVPAMNTFGVNRSFVFCLIFLFLLSPFVGAGYKWACTKGCFASIFPTSVYQRAITSPIVNAPACDIFEHYFHVFNPVSQNIGPVCANDGLGFVRFPHGATAPEPVPKLTAEPTPWPVTEPACHLNDKEAMSSNWTLSFDGLFYVDTAPECRTCCLDCVIRSPSLFTPTRFLHDKLLDWYERTSTQSIVTEFAVGGAVVSAAIYYIPPAYDWVQANVIPAAQAVRVNIISPALGQVNANTLAPAYAWVRVNIW